MIGKKFSQGFAHLVVIVGVLLVILAVIVYAAVRPQLTGLNTANNIPWIKEGVTSTPTESLFVSEVTDMFSIQKPLNGDAVNTSPIRVSGYIPYEAKISLLGVEENVDLDVKTGVFSAELKLRPGLNDITAIAENKVNGKKEVTQFSILYLPGENI